jgi:hypothetical protein
MFKVARFALVVFVNILILCTHPALATDAADAFNNGMDAFRAGRFEQALTQFEQARAAGIDSVDLHYNLGATYYKLGRYDLAAHAFMRVARHPPMAALAHYNLGLIALKTDDEAAAHKRFLQAYEETEDATLKTLAQRELARLPRPSPPARRWSASVSAAAGYDDNVIAPTELVPSAQGGLFSEIFATARGLLTGAPDDGLRIEASGYALRYQDLSAYDIGVVNAGVTRLRTRGKWDTEAGLKLEQSMLGDEDYLRSASATLAGVRAVRPGLALGLRYRFSYIESLNALYDPLGGTRHEFSTDGRWRFDRGRLRLVYALEANDRDDFQDGDFISYSPQRHGLRLIASRNLDGAWEAAAELGYRLSRYDDPETVAGAGAVAREDDRYQAALRLLRPLGEHWQFNIEYNYTYNVSTISDYDYQRNFYLLGLTGFF